MGNLYKIPRETKGMAGFTRDLGYEIETTLSKKGYDVDVSQCHLDGNDGFLITWNYHGKHSANVMISRNREADDENELIIDRFHGIRGVDIIRRGFVSTPTELRNAAQIYDEVTGLLENKFGKPISEHDGRSIYRSSLERTLVL